MGRTTLGGMVACALALAAVVSMPNHHDSPGHPAAAHHAAKWSETPALAHATWYRAHSLAEMTKGRDVVLARVVGAEPGKPLCPPASMAKIDPKRCPQTTYVKYVTEKVVRGHDRAAFKAFFVGTPGVAAMDEDPFPDKGDVNLLFLTEDCAAPGVLCFSGPDGRYDVRGGSVRSHARGGVAGKLNGKAVATVEEMVR